MQLSKILFASSILAFGMQAHAATTVPYTFSSGQPASAAQVNANFSTLATAITNLSSRIDKLEGSKNVTTSDISGTYNVMFFEQEVGTTHVHLGQQSATVTLSTSNNVSFTCGYSQSQDVSPNSNYGRTSAGVTDTRPFLTSLDASCDLPSSGITWTYSASTQKLTFSTGGIEFMPVGPGLLIGRSYGLETAASDTDSGVTVTNFHSGLVILVRTQ